MTALAQTGGLNDIFVEASTGTFKLSTWKAAYALIIADTIRNLVGELQLDVERGVDYEGTIWESTSLLDAWKDNVRDIVTGFDFVTSITSFDANVLDHGLLSYELHIATSDGDVTVSQVVYEDIPGGGGGGCEMENLIQNGLFYLPVFKRDGVQYYRQFTQYEDAETGVTTQISQAVYKKVDGVFVVV